MLRYAILLGYQPSGSPLAATLPAARRGAGLATHAAGRLDPAIEHCARQIAGEPGATSPRRPRRPKPSRAGRTRHCPAGRSGSGSGQRIDRRLSAATAGEASQPQPLRGASASSSATAAATNSRLSGSAAAPHYRSPSPPLSTPSAPDAPFAEAVAVSSRATARSACVDPSPCASDRMRSSPSNLLRHPARRARTRTSGSRSRPRGCPPHHRFGALTASPASPPRRASALALPLSASPLRRALPLRRQHRFGEQRRFGQVTAPQLPFARPRGATQRSPPAE